MNMYNEDTSKLENIADLKRSLEEAEILRSGMKLALMNPLLDSMCKGEYEKAFTKLNNEIRDLKMMMVNVRKRTYSLEPRECIM
jgi:hypothetical protein